MDSGAYIIDFKAVSPHHILGPGRAKVTSRARLGRWTTLRVLAQSRSRVFRIIPGATVGLHWGMGPILASTAAVELNQDTVRIVDKYAANLTLGVGKALQRPGKLHPLGHKLLS